MIEQQIAELNETVKCTLKPSLIDGIGVFAILDIKQGEKLYCKEGLRQPMSVPFKRFMEIRPEVREIILSRYPLVKKGSLFLSPNDDARLISFLNHDSNPNYDPFSDCAIRDIEKNEEVTEDYGKL